MGDASVGETLISALGLTLDGQGGTLHVDALSASELNEVVERARSAGLIVLDVAPNSATHPFAFGAFSVSLQSIDPGMRLELVEAHELTGHVERWLERELVLRLAELTSRAPVLAIVRDIGSHDSVAAAAVESIAARFAHEPVLWLVIGSPEDDTNPPVSIDTLDGLRSFADDAGLILELISVADAAPRAGELAYLGGLDEQRTKAVLDELCAVGIVAQLFGAYAFVNSALRHAVRASVPAALQRDTRRSWITVLNERGVDPVVLADGTIEVSSVGDEEGAQLLMRAMTALREDDPDTAARLGLGAASLLADPSDALTSHAWNLLPLLWQTGRSDQARALTRRVFTEHGEGEVEAHVLFWLARFEGSAQRAVQLTSHALEIPDISDAITAKLLGVRVRCLSTLGQTAEVDDALPRALQLAQASGDWETLSRLQSSDAIRAFYAGDYAASRSRSDTAHASFERSGIDPAEWMPELIWRPHLVAMLGDPASALARCDELIAHFTPNGQLSATRFLHAQRASILFAMGNLDVASDEALAAATASMQQWGVELGASDRLQSIPLSIRLKVAMRRGDTGELDDIRQVIDGLGHDLSPEATARVAWWRFMLDDAHPAQRDSNAWTPNDVDALAAVSWLDPTDEVIIYRALTRLGCRDRAGKMLVRARERADANPDEPLARALAEQLGGLGDSDAGALGRAAQEWQRLHRPILVADAQADRAVIIIDEARDEAIELLTAAHAAFEAAGSWRDAGRTRRILRDAGHHIRGEAHDVTANLTPAEARVVGHAVNGLTTTAIAAELFLSSHTVVSHLRSIYRKLGLRSRAELVKWAQSQITTTG